MYYDVLGSSVNPIYLLKNDFEKKLRTSSRECETTPKIILGYHSILFVSEMIYEHIMKHSEFILISRSHSDCDNTISWEPDWFFKHIHFHFVFYVSNFSFFFIGFTVSCVFFEIWNIFLGTVNIFTCIRTNVI